jgi:hypothetical protein
MRQLKRSIWPHQIALYDLDTKTLEDISKWCTEHLGYRFQGWYSYIFNGKEYVFAFKDDATLLVFKLKWGNYASRKTI